MKVHRGCAGARGVVTMIVFAVCPTLAAHGQLQERDALTPVIGGLPLSTDVVVVSSRPAAVLDALRGPWRRLGPVAAGLGSDSLGSWAAVARELGYRPGEAFKELTSGGVAVVVASPHGTVGVKAGAEGVGVDVEVRWAVLSVVKSGVAARVREKLKASPHEVIGGLPVLSVEEGRFALVCRGLTDAEGGDEVLALAPMEDRGFLESIVAAVDSARPRVGVGAAPGAKEPRLGDTKSFARAKRTPADVLILASEPDGSAGDNARPDWGRGSVIACALTDQTWTLDAVKVEADGAGAGVAPKVEHLPQEASALYDAWSANAGVMVTGSGLGEVGRSILSSLPGEGVAESAETRFLNGAEAACVYMGPSAANVRNATAGGGMSVWGAVRVKDRASLPAGVIDAVGCQVSSAIEGDWSGLLMGEGPVKKADGGGGEAVDPENFAQLPEFTLRVVSVKLAPGGPLGGATTGAASSVPASVAWFLCPVPGSSGGEREARWAAIGIEPRGDADMVSERHRGMKGVLKGASGAEPLAKAWLWRGVVRPGSLIGSLPGPMGFALGFSGIGSVKEVRFESWDEQGGEDPGVRTRVVVEWKVGG